MSPPENVCSQFLIEFTGLSRDCRTISWHFQGMLQWVCHPLPVACLTCCAIYHVWIFLLVVSKGFHSDLGVNMATLNLSYKVSASNKTDVLISKLPLWMHEWLERDYSQISSCFFMSAEWARVFAAVLINSLFITLSPQCLFLSCPDSVSDIHCW